MKITTALFAAAALLLPVSLQAQPNGSNDCVALCWRLESSDEPSTPSRGGLCSDISVREAFWLVY